MYIPDGVTENKTIASINDEGPEDDQKKHGLYGELKVVIKSARDLPNKDGFGQGVSDPLATVKLPDGQKWQTKVVKDNLNPDWNETKVFKVRLNKEVAAR